MSTVRILLALLLLESGVEKSLAQSTVSQCNATALATCLAPFSQYAVDDVTFNVGASNISAACSAFATASQCVSTQARCQDTDLAAVVSQWTGSKNFFTLICNPSQQSQYLQYQPCYVTPALQSNLNACVNAQINVISNVNVSQAASCNAYNAIMMCLESNAAVTCGSVVSAQYLTQIIVASYLPIVHLVFPCCVMFGDPTQSVGPACNVTQTGISPAVTVAAPLAAFVGLGLIVGIVATFAFKTPTKA